MAHGYGHQGPSGMPKQFVLCFDGTGNKFAGDESDSNVLKIFRVSGTASQETDAALTPRRCLTAVKAISTTTTNLVLAHM